MTERASKHLSDLGLFTGAPQHEHFCRMNELVETRRMAPAATPRGWETGEPIALPETFEFMGQTLSARELLTQTDTAALLVVKDGVIRHEQYMLTGGPHVNWLSMSVAKSFISALVGIALNEGLIGDVEEPISKYVPVDPGSAYDSTAIRSVLQMSSGARWNEDYHNQFVYVDPASAVTIVKLSANRAYGTAPDGSTNRDGECIEYLAAIAKSLVLRTLEDRLLLREEGPHGTTVVGGRAEAALRCGFSTQGIRERAPGAVDEESFRLRVRSRWARR